jgi:broad specificity phosphatase PhoE
MVTRVHFIRHGATTLSAEDRFAGAVDVPLSDEGRAQAERLGARLASTKLSALYASPLSRTVETARLVGAPQGLEPRTDAGLREIAHGHWEGLRRQEVEQRFASEYEAWQDDPFTFAPPEGETGLAVMARAFPVVREIVLRHANQNVAIVSHKATIRLLLCSVLGIDARGYRDRLDQAPACLNIVDFKEPGRARLMLYNDTSHYAQEARRAVGQLSKWWG